MERDNFNLLLLGNSERKALLAIIDFEVLLNGSANLYFGEVDHDKMIKGYIEDDHDYLDNLYKLYCAKSAYHLKTAEDLFSKGDFSEVSLELKTAESWRLVSMESYCGQTDLKEQDSNRQKNIARLPRPDSLTRLIIEIVKKNPGITEENLLKELEEVKKHGVIEDIEEEEIIYSHKGKLKSAPISGLKDRLSGAKKKN